MQPTKVLLPFVTPVWIRVSNTVVPYLARVLLLNMTWTVSVLLVLTTWISKTKQDSENSSSTAFPTMGAPTKTHTLCTFLLRPSYQDQTMEKDSLVWDEDIAQRTETYRLLMFNSCSSSNFSLQPARTVTNAGMQELEPRFSPQSQIKDTH